MLCAAIKSTKISELPWTGMPLNLFPLRSNISKFVKSLISEKKSNKNLNYNNNYN